jgi:hypothetical protein
MGSPEDHANESSERNSQATLKRKGDKHCVNAAASEYSVQDDKTHGSRSATSYSCASFAGDEQSRTSRRTKVGFDLAGSDVESDSSSEGDSESRYSDIDRGGYRRKAVGGGERHAQSSERKQHKQPLRGGITAAHYHMNSFGGPSESSANTQSSDQSQSLSPSCLQDDQPARKDFRMMQESAQSCFYDSFGEASSESSSHTKSDQSQSLSPSCLRNDQPARKDFRMMQESAQSFFCDSYTASSPKRGNQGDEGLVAQSSDRAITNFESPTETPGSAPRSVQSGSSDRAIAATSTECARATFENDETSSTISRRGDEDEETHNGFTSELIVNEGRPDGPSPVEWDMQEVHIKAQIEAAREEIRNRARQKQTPGPDVVPLHQLQSEGAATSEHSTQLEHVMAQLEAARHELQAATEEIRNSFKNKEPRNETPETESKSLIAVPAQLQNEDTSVGTKLEEDVLGNETPTVETANNRKSELNHKVEALEDEKRKLHEDIRLLEEANKSLKNEMVTIPNKSQLGKLGGGMSHANDVFQSPTPRHSQDDEDSADDSSTSSTAKSLVLFSPAGGLRAQILRQARDGVDARGLKSHLALDPDEADTADTASIGRSHMLFSPPRGPHEKIRVLKQTRDPSDHQRQTNPQSLDPEEEVRMVEVLSPIPIQEYNHSSQSGRSSDQEEALGNDTATVNTTNTRKSELYHKVDKLEEEKWELYERVRFLEEAKATYRSRDPRRKQDARDDYREAGWHVDCSKPSLAKDPTHNRKIKSRKTDPGLNHERLKTTSNQSVSSRHSAEPLHRGTVNGEGFKVKRSKSTSDQPAYYSHKARAKQEYQPSMVFDTKRKAMESTIRPIDVRVETRAERDIEREYCQKTTFPERKHNRSRSSDWTSDRVSSYRHSGEREGLERQVDRSKSSDHTSSTAFIGNQTKQKKDTRWSSQHEPRSQSNLRPAPDRELRRAHSADRYTRWSPQHEPRSKSNLRPAPGREVRRAHSADRMAPPASSALSSRKLAHHERPKRRPRPPKNLPENLIAKHSSSSPASPLDFEDVFANHQDFDVVLGDDVSIGGSAMTESVYDDPPVKTRHSSKASTNKLSLDPSDDPRWRTNMALGDPQPIQEARRTNYIVGNQTRNTKEKKDPRWSSHEPPDPSPVRGVLQRSKSTYEGGSLEPREVRRAHSADRIMQPSTPVTRRRQHPPKNLHENLDPISDDPRWTTNMAVSDPQQPIHMGQRTTKSSISERGRNSIQPDISDQKVTSSMLRANKSSDQMPKMPKPLRGKSKPISEPDPHSNSNGLQPDISDQKVTSSMFRAANNKSLDQMPKMPKPLRVKTKPKPKPITERGRSNSNSLLPDPIPKVSRAKSWDKMPMRSKPLLDPSGDQVVPKISRSKSSDHVTTSSSKHDNNNNNNNNNNLKVKVKQPSSKVSSKAKTKTKSSSSCIQSEVQGSSVVCESKPKSKPSPSKITPTRTVMQLLSIAKSFKAGVSPSA